MTDRYNLLTNPSFRYGTAGWASLGGAVFSIQEGFAFYGDQCLKVDTNNELNNSGIAAVNLVSVVPGKSYAALAHVLIPPVIPAVHEAELLIRIEWFTASGDPLVTEDSASVEVTERDGWVALSHLTEAPAGARSLRFSVVRPTLVQTADETYFYIDACLVEQATYVSGYIDTFDPQAKIDIVNRGLTPYQRKATESVPLRADVVLDNLILNAIDEDNVVWVCTDIDGWWGHSTPQGPDIERGFEDGSYDVSGRYQARSLTLSGTFLPPSPEDMPKARDRLISATDLVRRGAWLRTSEEPTRAAFVRLAGRPKIDTVNARGRTNFEIPLRAADPAKYHWNDLDPEGFTVSTIDANQGYDGGVISNIGTSDVTAIFRMMGPMGPKSTVYNRTTDETITLARPLRRAAPMAKVVATELRDKIAVLYTELDSGLYDGDSITVEQVGPQFNSLTGQQFTVISASRDTPYTVTYAVTGPDSPKPADVAYVKATGTISLAVDDVLDLDTYQKSVTFNGNGSGQRSRVETRIDWIKLAPGDNFIRLDTMLTHLDVSKKSAKNGVVTLTTTSAHQLRTGDTANVDFPTDAELSEKQLVPKAGGGGGVATVTTVDPHGFSVGDTISVTSISEAVINHKNVDAASRRVTMTTDTGPNGEVWDFAERDSVTITLPDRAGIIRKAYDGTYVTITTDVDHHFSQGLADDTSDGDLVNVVLPTTATITQKSLTNGLATLTFSGNHNFSLNDTLSVNLPYTTTTATTKLITGTTATITTSTPHNFSTGDLVTIAFPGTRTLATTATYTGAPNYTATVTTTANHGYQVGDVVDIAITNGSATNASVYNGQRIVQATGLNTLTFTTYGPDAASTDTIGGGTVANLTNSALNGPERQIIVTSPTSFTFTSTAVQGV